MSESEEHIMKVCSILANRYRDAHEYEDLYQEGFLAGWEVLQSGGDVPTAIGAMRRAMNNYKNISLKPVTIPKSGAAYALLSAINSDREPTPQGHTEVALYEALTSSTDSIQPNTMGVTESSEDNFIRKELFQYVVNHLWVYLDPMDAVVINLMYCQDYTQEEVATELGIPQGTVSKSASRGTKNLKKALEQVT